MCTKCMCDCALCQGQCIIARSSSTMILLCYINLQFAEIFNLCNAILFEPVMSLGRFHDFRCYLPSEAHPHYTRAVKPQQELPYNQAPALHEVLSVHYSSNIHERSHDESGKQPARLIRCKLPLMT